MPLRNKLTLRTEQHRTNQKWVFGVIFVAGVVAICWLLL